MSVIFLLALLLSLGAFAIGLKWEEIAAYIGGPTFLLLLTVYANNSLAKSTQSSPASDFTPVKTVQDTVEIVASEPSTNLLVVAAIGMILVGLAILVLAKLPTLSAAQAYWEKFLDFCTEKLDRPQRSAGGKTSHSKLYYETAIRLGALIAGLDGRPHRVGLETIKRAFNLRNVSLPGANAFYQSQLETPQDVQSIAELYLAEHHANGSANETLIAGMARLAMLDSGMSASELELIHTTAGIFGIAPGATRRILLRAGYFDSSTGSSSEHNQASYKAEFTEREQHLHTLGLPTDADKGAIRKAWRKLAAKYHPDKLMSQNLPAEEFEKAEDKMQSINGAYDWLKQHG